jgi:membrane-associated phospholipid phosphatase
MTTANEQLQLPRSSDFRLGFTHLLMAEGIVIAFFAYTASLSLLQRLPPARAILALFVPFALWALLTWVALRGRPWSRHLRHWLVPAAVLAGYWQMGWFTGDYQRDLQLLWVGWDRFLLDQCGLRWAIEMRAPWLAWWLELNYFLLYAVPAISLGALYWKGKQEQIGAFLDMFALGTFLVYALLPVLRVESPRTAFAGLDSPAVTSIWRSINVRILDRLDILTSVFPSGHVAVAFSSALAMRRALPDSPWGFRILLCVAVSVLGATIYGRYHYAMDGLASIIICAAAWTGLETYEKLM